MISEFHSYSQSAYLYTALQECFAVYVYTKGFEPMTLNLDVAIFLVVLNIKLSVHKITVVDEGLEPSKEY